MVRCQFRALLSVVLLPLAAANIAAGEPIHEAAARGDLLALTRAIKGGVDVDVKDRAGATALHAAAQHGR